MERDQGSDSHYNARGRYRDPDVGARQSEDDYHQTRQGGYSQAESQPSQYYQGEVSSSRHPRRRSEYDYPEESRQQSRRNYTEESRRQANRQPIYEDKEAESVHQTRRASNYEQRGNRSSQPKTNSTLPPPDSVIDIPVNRMSRSSSWQDTPNPREMEDMRTNRDNWQAGKNVIECNLYMLTHEISCDVTFLVGDTGEEVKGHKYMLMCRSSEFYDLLNQRADKPTLRVRVSDVTPPVFRDMLMYIYTDEIELNFTNATALLYPAHKFAIKGLTKKCFNFLSSEMRPENVCKILEKSHTYDEKSIHEGCLDFIYQNAIEVLKTSSFTDLCRECVANVIKSDLLRADEISVYDAMIAWANRACKRKDIQPTDPARRGVLKTLLYHIRFPAMDQLFFSQRVASGEVLSQEETISIFQYFHGEERSMTDRFNKVPRKNVPQSRRPKTDTAAQHQQPKLQQSQMSKSMSDFQGLQKRGEMTRVVRFQGFEGQWELNTPDAISFTCSHAVLLHGVEVFGPYKDADFYMITVTLFDDTGRQLCSEYVGKFTEKNRKTYEAFFTTPVKIPVRKMHTIQISIKGKPSLRGVGGKRAVEVEGMMFVFSESNRSPNGTGISIGQIPALLVTPNHDGAL